MSIDTRPRERNERGYAAAARRGPFARGDRDYGAYTSGANALRVDRLLDADDLDEIFGEDLDEVDTDSGRAAARSDTRRGRTAPAPQRRSAVPRQRRRRTPWVDEVTPASEPEAGAPPLPLALPRARFVMLMVALLVVGVAGVLVLNTKINENSFRLGDLKATQADLTLQEEQLRQQLADLESPGNLLAAANRLGLVPAGPPAHISLPDGRVFGVPNPAAGQ